MSPAREHRDGGCQPAIQVGGHSTSAHGGDGLLPALSRPQATLAQENGS
jgi:hypothetical protein